MSSKKETKTETTPWAPAQPYIKDAMGQQQGAYNTASKTIADYNPQIRAMIDKAMAGSAVPYASDARAVLDKTIKGDFVNSNPYTGGIADLIAKKTMGNYAATFGGAGRSHGGLAALLSAQGTGDAVQSFMGDQYNRERQLQQQAVMAAPAFNQDEYTALNNIIPAVNNAAMMPLNAANSYGAGITAVTSPYNTSTTVQKSSPGLGQILGGALMLGSALIPGVGPAMAGGLGGLIGGGSTLGSAASAALGLGASAGMRA